MKTRTFAARFCEREGLPPEEFRTVLFHRTLYAHARLIAGLVRWLKPRHFLADHEFIEDVGYLRSLQEFSQALGNFVEHPSNWGPLRRKFRIRVSARRMLKIVRTVFPLEEVVPPMLHPDRHTLEPFGRRPEGPAGAPPAKDPPAVQ